MEWRDDKREKEQDHEDCLKLVEWWLFPQSQDEKEEEMIVDYGACSDTTQGLIVYCGLYRDRPSSQQCRRGFIIIQKRRLSPLQSAWLTDGVTSCG